MVKDSGKGVTARIRESGFRATKPRVKLLTFLEGKKYPSSIQEIAESLSKHGIDQVTVYRTLDSFKRSGLVREVDLQQGRTFYEIAGANDDHHHVVCMECGRIENFDSPDHQSIAEEALKQVPSFASITGHSFELFGLCKKCLASGSERQ